MIKGVGLSSLAVAFRLHGSHPYVSFIPNTELLDLLAPHTDSAPNGLSMRKIGPSLKQSILQAGAEKGKAHHEFL
jgi:hypothetical protein